MALSLSNLSVNSNDFNGTRLNSVGSGVSITNPAASNNPEASRGRASAATSSLAFPTSISPDKKTLITFYDYQRSVSGSAERDVVGTITLPVPVVVTDEYNMDINNFDAGVLPILADMVSRGASMTPQENFDAVMNKAKALGSSVWNDPGRAAAIMLALSPVATDRAQDFARSRAGVINNPHTTATFNGVRLKDFSFTWRLSPRSQQDADSIVNIIEYIRSRMHPSETEGLLGYAFDYPDIVTVEFEGTRNLPQVNFSFIESFNVGNGNAGGMAFFRDGMPTDVEISLRLKEIDIRTRESFE